MTNALQDLTEIRNFQFEIMRLLKLQFKLKSEVKSIGQRVSKMQEQRDKIIINSIVKKKLVFDKKS